ncbi:DNA-methyltransferase [Aureispira anguillae]|uniref:Methyltransferase n=1 Tax=Aureispira anguillae TaxID=2864201 RepID=A0A915YFV2_9BACT|nr:site-specific DNA-methyltransferase [Aureispira anguillae]BDS12374.1 site-specific DNA-methyltransferase [Aureispira anguillae]
MINQIFNMDCLKGMAAIPTGSIDMIFADLPYGMLKTKYTKWDVKIPFEPLWEQYGRILKKNGVVVLTGVHPFTNEIINSIPKGYKYRELIWYKSSGSGFLNAKKQHLKQHENVLIIYRKSPVYHPQKYPIDPRFIAKGKAKKTTHSNKRKAFRLSSESTNYQYIDDGTRYPDSVLEFGESVLPVKSMHRKGMHPTEKPVDLVAYLIRSFTNKGETVLDNCIGSGTTAVAAILEQRNFIGFEMNQDYYQMAQERVACALKAV